MLSLLSSILLCVVFITCGSASQVEKWKTRFLAPYLLTFGSWQPGSELKEHKWQTKHWCAVLPSSHCSDRVLLEWRRHAADLVYPLPVSVSILEHEGKIISVLTYCSQIPPNFLPPTPIREANNKLQTSSSVILPFSALINHGGRKG